MTHTPQSLRELADKIHEACCEDPACTCMKSGCVMIDSATALRAYATHLETECKDAARYRWLRDKTIDVDVTMRALFSDVDRLDSDITCMYAELLRATDDLDAAIDAAMQAEGETK